jgi:hypothetical protein
MRAFHFLRRGGPSAIVLALTLTVLPCKKSFAATDWTPIQTALGADGVQVPGDVLRFELVRKDLSLTINGKVIPPNDVAEYANGYIAFQQLSDSRFFADGSLPAKETELGALQSLLRLNGNIHITAIVNHAVLESPKLIWVHFEATDNGPALAKSLATALKIINSPQLDVVVIPGTNNAFNPSMLPPPFNALFDEGFVEQLDLIFAFYLPRPDEDLISVGPVAAEPGLGVGQSFYILIPSSGSTNQVTLNIELALRADEIQAVEELLRSGGFKIAAQHNHFVNDHSRLFFVHATASGDGFALGNTLYNVVQIIQKATTANENQD